MQMNAEAEGTKNKLMAEAEGKKALLFAEADALTKREMAPALALEKMVSAFGGAPDLLVKYKMVDQYKDIAAAQERILEHVQLGDVHVYGDSNTGAQFAKSFVENFAPALTIINEGFGKQFADVFGKKKNLPKQEETKVDEETKVNNDTFEEVK